MATPRNAQRPRSPADAERLAPRTHGGAGSLPGRFRISFGVWLGIGLLLGGVGVAAASPVAPVSPTTPTVSSSWAWGAAANLSYSIQYVGAYNSSATGLGANLTVPGAIVVFAASASLQYATYAVVTATITNGTQLTLAVTALQYRGLAVSESIQGTLPVAGTYAPNATIPLANQSASVAIRESVLDAARASLNYSLGPTGSLTLVNEHLQYLRAVNLSLSASSFPNLTANPNGTTTLKYVSGAISASGVLGLDLSGTFSPGLVLIPGPVNSTTSWNGTTNVTWNGTVAYASSTQASLPGGPTISAQQSAKVHLVRTDALALTAAVIGQRSVVLPNGSTQTEYVVNYTVTSTGAGAEIVDGLIAAVPIHAATAPVAPHATPATRALVPAGRTLPVGSESTPSGSQVVTGVPMSPGAASSAMHGIHGLPMPAGGPAAPPYALGLIAMAAIAIVGAFAVRREVRRSR